MCNLNVVLRSHFLFFKLFLTRFFRRLIAILLLFRFFSNTVYRNLGLIHLQNQKKIRKETNFLHVITFYTVYFILINVQYWTKLS
jgi:hypothetical protein